MKVFAETPLGLSRAMNRVVAALKQYAYAYDVEFVMREEDADLVILHVIGYPETETAVVRILDRAQRYVIVQYCMRSTQQPSTIHWLDIWQRAQVVWSYYNLESLFEQDTPHGHPYNNVSLDRLGVQFYRSPLGVDPAFLVTRPIETKAYTILTSGFVAESEGVHEVEEAIARIHGRQFHLGPRSVAPTAYLAGSGISDEALADVYARSCWVAGLRRAEGFEMPAVEGLMCGARPIVFDAPHYRDWFEPWADFIPEGSFAMTVDALVNVFESGCRVVSHKERKDAAALFNWETIVEGFWKAVFA